MLLSISIKNNVLQSFYTDVHVHTAFKENQVRQYLLW